jgi:hypothetical protein
MYLHVLYEGSGKILAAVELKGDKDEGGVPLLRPVAQRGQRTADVTVPDELRHLSFVEVCTQLVVQPKGDGAVLVSRKQKQRAASSSRPAQKASLSRPAQKSPRRKTASRTRAKRPTRR